MRFDTVIKNGDLVLPGQGVKRGSIGINDGKIAAIVTDGTELESSSVIDAGGKPVIPGVIDPHVHWGYTTEFENQAEGDSRSGALGGVTTALLYYRWIDGVTSEGYVEKKAVGEQYSYIDFAFDPIIRKASDAAWIETGMREFGISNFKFFMAYKGASGFGWNTGGNELDDGLMYHCFRLMSRFEPAMASVHAENYEISEYFLKKAQERGLDGLKAWHLASPGMAEAENAMRACYFAELAGVPVYIVHLGSRESVEIMRRVKQTNHRAYAETCPHYLARSIDSPIGNLGKISPPIRTEEEVELCWEGVKDGTFDCIGSDNTGTTLANKRGTIWEAMRGFPGIGTLLPIVLSEGVNKRGLSLERAVEVTSTTAAKLFGIWGKKGAIAEGFDADLNIIDLKKKQTVTLDLLQHWSDYNIYEGMELQGWPVLTMLRGRIIAENSKLVGERGYGRCIERTVVEKEAQATEEDEVLGPISIPTPA